MNKEITGRKEVSTGPLTAAPTGSQEVESKLVEGGQTRAIRHAEVGGGGAQPSAATRRL